MKNYFSGLLFSLALPMSVPAAAHDNVMSFDEMSAAFGWDIETAEIATEKITEGLYVLFGMGGNIVVSIGGDGTLIVDDQLPQVMPKIKAALTDIGSKNVDFAVNTHWHFDHADGNLVLGKEGTWIVSHINSRKMMLKNNLINFGPFAYEQEAYPAYAASDITFDTSMQFHFNGELIELMHYGAAHTDGDTVVIFRGKNAVHMGDVYNNSGYPFIDADNGGTLAGMIAFNQSVYDIIDDQTVVIPGHGPVANKAKMARYIEVLKAVEARVQTLINEGKGLDAIIAAKPTAAFDQEMNAPEFAIASFLSRVYTSMTKK